MIEPLNDDSPLEERLNLLETLFDRNYRLRRCNPTGPP
jgi:hypothetical protein